MPANALPAIQSDYERLRLHGMGHDEALDVIEDVDATGSPLRCWCGSLNLCVGGARRHIGCPLDFLGLPHARSRSDLT